MIAKISFCQDSTVYVAKARLQGTLKRYTCAKLILRKDSTYYYEEIAGDLLMDTSNGVYVFPSDTIYLIRGDSLPPMRYVKNKKCLRSLEEYTLGRKLKKVNVP
jgi:hypothetical protein